MQVQDPRWCSWGIATAAHPCPHWSRLTPKVSVSCDQVTLPSADKSWTRCLTKMHCFKVIMHHVKSARSSTASVLIHLMSQGYKYWSTQHLCILVVGLCPLQANAQYCGKSFFFVIVVRALCFYRILLQNDQACGFLPFCSRGLYYPNSWRTFSIWKRKSCQGTLTWAFQATLRMWWCVPSTCWETVSMWPAAPIAMESLPSLPVQRCQHFLSSTSTAMAFSMSSFLMQSLVCCGNRSQMSEHHKKL